MALSSVPEDDTVQGESVWRTESGSEEPLKRTSARRKSRRSSRSSRSSSVSTKLESEASNEVLAADPDLDEEDVPEPKTRVRFRSSSGLVQVNLLCDSSAVRSSRRGRWRPAPEDDPIWDSVDRNFREKELPPEEVAEIIKERRRYSNQAGILRFSLLPRRSDLENVKRNLAEQGTFKETTDDQRRASARWARHRESGCPDTFRPVVASHHQSLRPKSVLRNKGAPVVVREDSECPPQKSDASETQLRLAQRKRKDSLKTRYYRRLRRVGNKWKMELWPQNNQNLKLAILVTTAVSLMITTRLMMRLLFVHTNPIVDFAVMLLLILVLLGVTSAVVPRAPSSIRRQVRNFVNHI